MEILKHNFDVLVFLFKYCTCLNVLIYFLPLGVSDDFVGDIKNNVTLITEILNRFLVCVSMCVCVCQIASCATLLLIMNSVTLAFEGSLVNLHMCMRFCACMLMLVCQSKPPLGSQSHQLLIKLVSQGSTGVLTDVRDAGECVSVCIRAAALDCHTVFLQNIE